MNVFVSMAMRAVMQYFFSSNVSRTQYVSPSIQKCGLFFRACISTAPNFTFNVCSDFAGDDIRIYRLRAPTQVSLIFPDEASLQDCA